MSISCPSCGSIRVRRSKRRGLEKALSLIFMRPLRCIDCYQRFFGWPLTHRRHPALTEGAARTDLDV
jgi:hypothetical protein